MASAPRADVFRAIADPTRRALLDRLHDSDCSVVDLARPFNMSRPAVSQHLRILKQAGLVRARRAGRHSLYRLDTRPIKSVHAWAGRFLIDPSGHVWNLRQAIKPPTERS